MTTFHARRDSEAVVQAGRDKIWAALTDPGLVAQMTPLLTSIEVDGDHWRWIMTRIPGLGSNLAPTFTERMVFDEPNRIDFTHDPPDGARERAGVEGTYVLEEVDDGTKLAISLGVQVDLPLSRLAAPAAEATMRSVLDRMGKAFSTNLLAHLGVGS